MSYWRLDDAVGFGRVRAVHLNDSKGKRGSHLDRHEQIGAGRIGDAGFRLIMNDRRFEGVPMVLETPGGVERYAEELKKLRLMIEG